MGISLDSGGGLGSTDDADSGSAGEVVAEINITPLTDVFLVLLIIFMVTSTAMVESEVASRSGMKVILPKADAAGPVSDRKPPVLTVTKGGELALGTRKIEIANLEAELRKALQESGGDMLLIRGDTALLLGDAMKVMSTAKKAGANQIQILTAPGGP